MTTIIQLDRTELIELIESSVQRAVSEVMAPTPEPLPDRITDIKEVKAIINQGESWVYKHTMKACPDPLPYQKFGKRLVFSRKELLKWMERRTKPAPTADSIMAERLAKSAKKYLK